MGFAGNVMATRAGKLYRDTTPAELSLECEVARLGVPYRIQFPYYLWGVRYFPDFVLPTLKVVIEVDDESHNRRVKQEADAVRTEELNALGWEVVRCTNREALEQPRETVRRLLASIGRDPARPVCSLQSGLPQKREAKAGRRSRGETRQARLGKSAPPTASHCN
jgi:very-short-patch-repair endonuclease